VSNGIDFVIGGKDKAQPAMSAVEKSLQRLEQKTDSVGKSTQRLAAITGTLTTVYVAVKAALAALGGLNRINAAYDAQTESVKKLNAALQIRGASEASKGMQDVAKSIEKMTGVSDNAALALMQQASGMGFATGKMDDAAKAAIGLGAAMGKDAASAMGDLKAALEGNFDAFYAVNPQIMYMRTNQERLAAVMAIANQGLAQQAADMTTVAGSGRRADSAMSTLMESIGKIIAPIRVLINAGLQQLATSLDSLLVPAVEFATRILENIGPIMDYVKEKVVQAINVIVGAFTFMEVVVTNLGSVWEIIKNSTALAMEWMAQEVAHTLIERIPAYTMWFVDNFPNLIRDGVNLAFTALKNRLQQMADAVAAFFVFIETGGQTDIIGQLGEIAGRNLVEGFKSSLTSLPEIAARQLTEREKDLAEKIGAVGGRLGEEFSNKMRDRMLGVGSTLSSEVQNAASSIDLKMRPSVLMQGIPATEGRLLTRGPGTRLPDMLQQILQELRKKPDKERKVLVRLDDDQNRLLQAVAANTQGKMQLEAIA
jgi:uncharacterized protein YoxC